MAVPWVQIIQWAPQIISLSRDLVNKARKPAPAASPVRAENPSDLAARISALEDNERRQAELVDRMAAQQAELAKAVIILHRRQRALIIAVVVLALALVFVRWLS